jgi:hypothetical protein
MTPALGRRGARLLKYRRRLIPVTWRFVWIFPSTFASVTSAARRLNEAVRREIEKPRLSPRRHRRSRAADAFGPV